MKNTRVFNIEVPDINTQTNNAVEDIIRVQLASLDYNYEVISTDTTLTKEGNYLITVVIREV